MCTNTIGESIMSGCDRAGYLLGWLINLLGGSVNLLGRSQRSDHVRSQVLENIGDHLW